MSALDDILDEGDVHALGSLRDEGLAELAELRAKADRCDRYEAAPGMLTIDTILETVGPYNRFVSILSDWSLSLCREQHARSVAEGIRIGREQIEAEMLAMGEAPPSSSGPCLMPDVQRLRTWQHRPVCVGDVWEIEFPPAPTGRLEIEIASVDSWDCGCVGGDHTKHFVARSRHYGPSIQLGPDRCLPPGLYGILVSAGPGADEEIERFQRSRDEERARLLGGGT